MEINQTSSAIQQKNLFSGNHKSSSFSNVKRLSFENIRVFRQQFEQETFPSSNIVGDEQHQTMLVAMYEGTEKLLNQDVSEFAVIEYLEGLKLTAKELLQQGISGDKFRSTLREHSVSTELDLVRSS